FDRDPGDRLAYAVTINGQPLESKGGKATTTFDKPGTYAVRLTVADPHGATGTADTEVHVGNAPPIVRFIEPAAGGFYDWGQPVGYRAEATDEEDGTIAPERVIVRADYQVRRRASGDEGLHPGL